MNEQANLNSTASANRTHIGFFGCRNAGKSSVVNAVTGQDLAVVSEVKGTTTDPVTKAMEILPLGPVVIIDTPGFDDTGMLGSLRVKKTRQILNRTDIAVLVVDETIGITKDDQLLLDLFKQKLIPHMIVFNKLDLCRSAIAGQDAAVKKYDRPVCHVSARTGEGIRELKELLAGLLPGEDPAHTLTGHLAENGQVAVLVCPIDASAPKGRMIMPQQMAIRSVLDAGGMALVTRETELEQTLNSLKEPPAVVITDSQAFSVVNALVPPQVPLTSFSILMAKYKGFLDTALQGAAALPNLKDHDRVLMAEGCTHHRQCQDIGTVKIPNWLRRYTGAQLEFDTCTGRDFPDDLSPWSMVIHCGGCMITEREVLYRMKCAMDQGIPFLNYGIAIAQMNGILERSISALEKL